MLKPLTDYHIILTGGTGFLGREIISELLSSGAKVYTNFRDKKKVSDLEAKFGNTANFSAMQADLTVEDEVVKFYQNFREKFKRLDVFFHIMGGFWMGKEIADTPLQKWDQMLNLNLRSTFLCSRESFKMMREQCSGKIFTVSAKTAQEFPAFMGAYSVSKAAVLGLTKVLANEGKKYGIQVNSLLPGIIDTPANRKDMPDANYDHWVNPKDIAKLLVQLCKPEVKILSQTALKVFGKV
jgi:NAD(P)-dependent dehydrogenase (short-subunit alcohol dehydrogenase family)